MMGNKLLTAFEDSPNSVLNSKIETITQLHSASVWLDSRTSIDKKVCPNISLQ